MTPREGVFYAAWMGGIIATVTVGRALNFHHLLSLDLGVGIGYGLGFMAEKAFDRYQSRRDDDEPFGGSRDDHRK